MTSLAIIALITGGVIALIIVAALIALGATILLIAWHDALADEESERWIECTNYEPRRNASPEPLAPTSRELPTPRHVGAGFSTPFHASPSATEAQHDHA